MPELTITTRAGKGRAAHDHIVYLDEASNIGWTSEDRGHNHSFQKGGMMDQGMFPGTPEAPNLNMADPGWMMLPDDTGHTHGIGTYKPVESTKPEEDTQIVMDVISLFKAAGATEAESFKKGEESEKFYLGEHWDAAQKADLEAKARASLVINKVQKEVHDLSGHQRENRTDLKYLPVEGGDARVADLLNVITKVILSNTDFEREESKVFLDQVIPGRGLFNLYFDNEADIRGQIKVEKFPWRNVRFGPHEKEDLSDCEYLVKWTWYSADKIKQMWPEKADEIQASVDAILDPDGGLPHDQVPGKQYTDAVQNYNRLKIDPDLTNIASKEFRVLELWRRIYKRVSVIVDVTNDWYFNAEDWSKTDVGRVKSIPGLKVVPRNISKMRITKTAGTVLLEDENPADLEFDDFYITPAYAIKRGDIYQGIVELIKDPQRLIDKLASLSVDIANKMTAYGWFVDEETFASKFEEENFKKNSTSPGFISKVLNLNKVPMKVEGVKMPNELVNMMVMFDQTLNDLMSMSPEPLGSNDSGVAILQKVRTKIRGVEYLFDNLSFAKKRLGKQLVAMIREHYTPEMLLRIVSDQSRKQQVMVGGMPFEQYAPEIIMALLENDDLTKYDIAVGEGAFSPTARLANFAIWADMAKGGIPVPPDLLVELSDLPDKQKVLESIRQFQAQQAQAEQQKQQTEIEKTKIAAAAKREGGAPGMPPGPGNPPSPGNPGAIPPPRPGGMPLPMRRPPGPGVM